MFIERGLLAAGVLSCGLIISGCDGSDPADMPTGSISSNELQLPLPGRIRSISAIDPADIVATAIVNGVPTTLQASSNGGYRGAIQVPAQTAFTVQIEFSEIINERKLVLATISQQVTTGSANQQLNIRRAGYDFVSHDDDSDSVSNIVEREENTDPFDAAQSPDMINVSVTAKQPELLAGRSFNQYLFEASVGQSAKILSASGSDFRGDFYIVNRAPLTASVEMVETTTGQQYTVASQSRDLNAITDQQAIVFEANSYSVPDRDNDGRSDIIELLAGTDITVSDNSPVNPPVNSDTLVTAFNVPASIQNANNAYAEYRVNGQLVSLTRSDNSFSASSGVTPGSNLVLDISILDNYLGQPYVLAAAQRTLVAGTATQTVSFREDDFLLDQDTDNDGVANYLERERGSDPFNAPAPVSCTIGTLPVTTGQAGSVVTVQNISSFIDCGSADYALSASSFGFNWSAGSNNISWTIPSDSVSGSTISYTLNITNPAATTVYLAAQVQSQVSPAVCTDTAEQLQFVASKDLFFQGGALFNNNELRVNSSARRALLGFEVPEQEGVLTAAALLLTVGDDSGSGTISVYQDDSYDWDEDDDDLELPVLSNIVGSRNGVWQTGVAYEVGLDALFVNGTELNLFLSQNSGGNDVAFNSRETATPPVLVLEYNRCL